VRLVFLRVVGLCIAVLAVVSGVRSVGAEERKPDLVLKGTITEADRDLSFLFLCRCNLRLIGLFRRFVQLFFRYLVMTVLRKMLELLLLCLSL